MCGILLSNYKSKKFKKALISQSYRGPDGHKIINSNNINMGFNYLSIQEDKKIIYNPMCLKIYTYCSMVKFTISNL